MWIELKKILPQSIEKLGLGVFFEFSQISLRWDKIITELLGMGCVNKSKPISLKNKTLLVDCLNSVWASEFQLNQQKIIKEINQALNKDLIEKITFIS